MTELTNEEIRLRIAKAKGLEYYMEVWWMRDPITHKADPVDAPLNWPASIADAWELVDELKGFVTVKKVAHRKFGRPESEITYHYEVDINGFHGAFDHPVHTEALTAPVAICLAYLKWKEKE